MKRNIKLLETRVTRVVDRLRELTEERRSLQNELQELRQEFEKYRTTAATTENEELAELQDRRQQAVELIRETLSEMQTC
ncbi:MAG: hypothetical protein GY716_11335 [bacterium]|nr:hypothetical protein [bacterium]